MTSQHDNHRTGASVTIEDLMTRQADALERIADLLDKLVVTTNTADTPPRPRRAERRLTIEELTHARVVVCKDIFTDWHERTPTQEAIKEAVHIASAGSANAVRKQLEADRIELLDYQE